VVTGRRHRSLKAVDAVHVRWEVAWISRRVNSPWSQRRRTHELVPTRWRLVVYLGRRWFPVTRQGCDVIRRRFGTSRRHRKLPCLHQDASTHSHSHVTAASQILREVNWFLPALLELLELVLEAFTTVTMSLF